MALFIASLEKLSETIGIKYLPALISNSNVFAALAKQADSLQDGILSAVVGQFGFTSEFSA